MDLVRLSISGGLALASVMTLASVARLGQAEPLPSPMLDPASSPRTTAAVRSPVLVQPGAPTPVVRLSSDPAFGGLSLFPAASDPARPATFDQRWRGDPSAWDAYVDEASRRFGVSPEWIRRVMRVESGGRQFLNGLPITSSKGAMGLMQVMPGTYADLRARYGLGSNPYDPRDNVLAGTAYLREMYERFGASGFLAAYNAGPTRFGDFVARGRPLPAETIRYVADVGRATPRGPARLLGSGGARRDDPVQDLTSAALVPARVPASAPLPPSPEEAPLFTGSSTRVTAERVQASAPAGDGLFVVLTNADRRRDRSPEDIGGN